MFCSGLVHNLQQVQCLVKVEFKSTKYGPYRLSQTFAFVMVMEWHWERGMTVKRNLCGILETFQDGFQDRWCPAKRKTSWPHLKISSCWSCLAFFVAIVGFQIWMLLYFFVNIVMLLLLWFGSCYCLLVPKIKPLALSLRFSEFKRFDRNDAFTFPTRWFDWF